MSGESEFPPEDTTPPAEVTQEDLQPTDPEVFNEVWVVPVTVYDGITASETAGVLRGIGYLVGEVYRIR